MTDTVNLFQDLDLDWGDNVRPPSEVTVWTVDLEPYTWDKVITREDWDRFLMWPGEQP